MFKSLSFLSYFNLKKKGLIAFLKNLIFEHISRGGKKVKKQNYGSLYQ